MVALTAAVVLKVIQDQQQHCISVEWIHDLASIIKSIVHRFQALVTTY